MPGGDPRIDAQSRDHQDQYEMDTATDEVDRVAERAREDADGTLARLWKRLRALVGRR